MVVKEMLDMKTIDGKDMFDKEFMLSSIKNVLKVVRKNTTGLNYFLNPQLNSIDEKNREIILEFELKDWYMNTVGNLHGGMMASICDVSMGVLAQHICYNTGGLFSPTTSLNMTYLNVIKREDNIKVKVKLMSEGKSLLNLRAEIYVNDNEKPATLANGTYKVLKEKR